MTVVLVVLCLLFATGFVVAARYAWRWASIIFMFEDDLNDAIETHERTIQALQHILDTPMLSENEKVRQVVNEAMSDVKLSQTATQRLIYTLTQRSKQRYVRVVERQPDEETPYIDRLF